MSHTHVPEFRLKVNDALVTENHVLAWISGVPVVGVTGDRALASELDGVLDGTPFLEVKRSASRTETFLRFSNSNERAAAIREFASACLQTARTRDSPAFERDSEVVISMSPRYIDSAVEADGVTRRSAATLAVTGSDWNRDIWQHVRMAARAASTVLDEFASQLDLTSPGVVTAGDERTLQGLRDRFDTWMHTLHPAWVE
jgi:D-aminopeptidase